MCSVRNVLIPVHLAFEGFDLPPMLPIPPLPAALNVSRSGIAVSDAENWTATSPPHNGLVRLSSSLFGSDSQALQDPLAHASAEGGKKFSLAMYHQLHCLDSLRTTYTLLQTPPLPASASEDERVHHDEIMDQAEMTYRHAPHCLDVIRQALLCHADTTLEPSQAMMDGKTGEWNIGAGGYNVVKKCRNWEAIRAWVDTNQKGWVKKS